MLIQKLTTHDRVLLLKSRNEARRAERRIGTAVRRGGAFVKMKLLSGDSVKMLVSPGTVAYFDEISVDDDVAVELDEVELRAVAYAAEFG